MEIKLYGLGCPTCLKVDKIIKEAITKVDGEVTYTKINDLTRIAGDGIMAMPTVALNGKVVCSGRIPSLDETVDWLKAEQK